MNADTDHRPVVQLVGAGPGDPELLTVKAIRAIRQATVLLVDDLVGEGVLRYARRSARIVPVGKRGGCASTPQAFIERLMVAEAMRGERVVRLKGGDPFVFGRGGEEAEHLRALGLDVVDASTASRRAWRQRPRSTCRSPTATTPTASSSSPATHVAMPQSTARTPHWPTLAAAAAEGLTLVIYMGIATVESLQAGLSTALSSDTPVAIVQHASLPQQRSTLCTSASSPRRSSAKRSAARRSSSSAMW